MQIQPGRYLYSRSERADLVRMLLDDGVSLFDAARWLRDEFEMPLDDACDETFAVTLDRKLRSNLGGEA